MLDCVIDASVVIKWFYEASEDHVQAARNIMRRALEKEIFLVAPDILLYELGNTFGRDVGLSEADCNDNHETLFSVGITFINIDREWFLPIFKNVRAYALTFYDAAYLTVAQERNIPLVTEDKDILATGLTYVKSLKEFRTP